jgi:hypothetical protein
VVDKTFLVVAQFGGWMGFVLLAVLGLVLVRRRVPLENLKEQHEVAAVSFAVLGGLYGIVLAFVLVSSWERFETARAKAEIEANALGNLYRHAEGFSPTEEATIRRLTIEYAQAVIHHEWDEMGDGTPDPRALKLYEQIWESVLRANAADAKAVALYQNTLGQLDDFSDGRRDRLLYARVGMPVVVWTFLIATGAVTVAFSYFFGMKRLMPQLLMTAALAATISAALMIISEMQTPFSGSLQVPPVGLDQFLRLHGAPPEADKP